jgi:hypothetical protein
MAQEIDHLKKRNEILNHESQNKVKRLTLHISSKVTKSVKVNSSMLGYIIKGVEKITLSCWLERKLNQLFLVQLFNFFFKFRNRISRTSTTPGELNNEK